MSRKEDEVTPHKLMISVRNQFIHDIQIISSIFFKLIKFIKIKIYSYLRFQSIEVKI